MRKPNPREQKVLRQYAGTPEPWGRFVGAGKITFDSLLVEGGIRPKTDPNYPAEYYEITSEGEEAAYR